MIVDRHLRAAMQFETGKVAADGVVDAEVLQDDRVDADRRESGESFDQFGQFVLANQRVDGDEDASPRRETVRVGGDLGKFVEREVLGLGSGGELFQAQVDCVGAEVERGVACVKSAGGG